MNIVRLPSGIDIVDGKFWMIQRADLGKKIVSGMQFYATDAHNNPRLSWPGRSVFDSYELACNVASTLAQQSPDFPYVVMEAMEAFAQARPPILSRKL